MSRKRAKLPLVSAINVVPYIDVMLVLLVVFMATAPLLTEGIYVDLPKAGGDIVETDTNEERIVVSIDKQGQYYFSLNGLTSAALPIHTVQQQVATQLKKNEQTGVYVKGDASVLYGQVVTLMAALQAIGVPNIGLITAAPEATP